MEKLYLAVSQGTPKPAKDTIFTHIGRHPNQLSGFHFPAKQRLRDQRARQPIHHPFQISRAELLAETLPQDQLHRTLVQLHADVAGASRARPLRWRLAA